MQTIANFIDNEFVPALSGKFLDNYEPATGKVYSQIPDSNEADVRKATDSAERAFKTWRLVSVEKRSEYLLKIAALIERDSEQLARAESVDNGKPFSLAKNMDISRAAANFRFFAHAITQFSSECYPQEESFLNYTVHDPVGVVGCISPWNLPLYLFTWKIAPAIAAGNCVVAKPSEVTPMTAFLLCKLVQEAGLPPGVLNVVHGLGASVGEAMVLEPKVKAISFTGGTSTGKRIAAIAAPLFKKLSLELGGKNPTIVFDDCNFEEAVSTAVKASFLNQGEICLCGSRVLVQRGVYEKFKEAFVAKARKLNVADPLEEGTQQGAVVSEAHYQKILKAIALAKEEGGKILLGGAAAQVAGERCKNGWFIQPTVIEGLPWNCRTNQEEIFGPVVTLMPFSTEEEAIQIANSTTYGLAASIWTENLGRAHRISRAVESGIVWVNCWLVRDLRTPFGGMKASGVGREGGMEALKFFTEPKNICVKVQP